jgi:hypothetical protein
MGGMRKASMVCESHLIFMYSTANDTTEVDKKEEWPEADARASTSAPPPKHTEKAAIPERQCIDSGGHAIQTIFFRPGGAAAIAVTVLVALWKKKPLVCERCQKELGEEDLQDVWERRERACRGRGRATKQWKGKGCARDGSGFYAERSGRRRQRQERPRCGRGRRNSF